MEPVVSLCIVLPEKLKEATHNTLFLRMAVFITLNFSCINHLKYCGYYTYHLLWYSEARVHRLYVFHVILRTESDYFLKSFKRLVFVMEIQFTFSGRGTELFRRTSGFSVNQWRRFHCVWYIDVKLDVNGEHACTRIWEETVVLYLKTALRNNYEVAK